MLWHPLLKVRVRHLDKRVKWQIRWFGLLWCFRVRVIRCAFEPVERSATETELITHLCPYIPVLCGEYPDSWTLFPVCHFLDLFESFREFLLSPSSGIHFEVAVITKHDNVVKILLVSQGHVSG